MHIIVFYLAFSFVLSHMTTIRILSILRIPKEEILGSRAGHDSVVNLLTMICQGNVRSTLSASSTCFCGANCEEKMCRTIPCLSMM